MVEEFVQISMEIDDAKEEDALSIKVSPRCETVGLAVAQKSMDFCATMTARCLPEEEDSERASVNIVVALDISGSMNGRKLELCKETLSLLLRELSSEDRFGLITFGSQAKLEIPARKLTDINRKLAISKIKSIQTLGQTNMSGGIGMAINELQFIESTHEVRTIFLLTDGLANIGVSNTKGIVYLTKGCLESESNFKGDDKNGTKGPISIHCFGYGLDHDREMLHDISQATQGGTYYFVEQDCNVLSAFGDALGGVLSVVAQNTVVTLKAPDEARELGVLILNVKHDKAVKQPDGSYEVCIGDFYAEESRDIIVETTLSSKGNDNATGIPHLLVGISYLDTINKKLVPKGRTSITANILRPEGIDVLPTNIHVVLQCIRIKAIEVISDAEKLANSNQLEKAKSTISNFMTNLQQEATQLGALNDPLISQLLMELQTIISGLVSRSEYLDKGSKYMTSRTLTHRRQRCTESTIGDLETIAGNHRSPYTATSSVYQSKKKAGKMAKFMSPGSL